MENLMDDKNNNYKQTNDTNTNETVSTANILLEGRELRTIHSHSNHSGTHGEHHGSYHHRDHHHHSRHKHSHHHHREKKGHFNISAKGSRVVVISICVLLLVFAVVVGILDSKQLDFSKPQTEQPISGTLVVEVNNQEGLLIKNAVHKYLLTDILNPANANVLPASFSTGEGRLDEQVPVSLKLSVREGNAISYKIELASSESFKDAKIFYVEAPSGIYEFRHLCANTTYYYRVTVYTNKGIDSVDGYFRTADTPRILSIDGLSNVRDIGNWRTDSGKKIKQGLLIRGTEMDAAVESGYHLTNEGLKDMLDTFCIKTDMDLRAQTVTSKDALGPQVEHIYYDMVQYGEIFTDEGKEKVRMVFADLANPDKYPIYLHCTYGRDRTGTICYLLEAVLGVSRGDCLKDYSLSNSESTNIKVVEKGLAKYDGETLKEQAESYLLSCGVSEYQINSIRNIFLGD